MRRQWMLRLAITSIAVLGIESAGHTFASASATTDKFFTTMSTPVKTVANQYKLYPSVMMAQAALESGWGTSQLSLQANNYFGIKGAYNGASVSMNTAEYNSKGQLYYTQANFKKYPTIAASMTDNAQLLRNGTAWDASYYSGTWRENAATYQDAANALTGKYATAPTYGTSLINLIQTYNFNSLDGTSTTTSTAPVTEPAKTVQKTPSKKVTYYTGADSQTAALSGKYHSYAIYNHVKGSTYKTTKYSWTKVGGWTGRPVWLDARGYKSATKTNWYRVRFSKQTTAKKYWVYSKTLSFPKTSYANDKATATLASTNSPIYNHVFNSAYVAKQIATTSALAKQSITVDKKATHVQSGVTTTWYRIHGDSVSGWVTSKAISKLN